MKSIPKLGAENKLEQWANTLVLFLYFRKRKWHKLGVQQKLKS